MINVNGVEGHLIPGDIGYLVETVEALPAAPTIVEIGSWKGLSAIVMANARPDAEIHCIDTWQGSAEHAEDDSVKAGTLYDEFQENVAHLGERIEPWCMRSEEAAIHFLDESVDMVFVDGDHSFNGCLNDLLAWLPKLGPGGIMIVHDCNDNGVSHAVERFCDEKGFSVHVTAPPHAHYMGRIRW